KSLRNLLAPAFTEFHEEPHSFFSVSVTIRGKTPVIIMLAKVSNIVILCLCYLLIPLRPARSDELFTAQIELEAVFSSQSAVVEAVEIYLAKERARLNEIKKILLPLDERSRKDSFQVVSNPISAFLLVKSLTVDLDDLLSITQQKQNADELARTIEVLKTTHRFPSKEDLSGAAVAITRLQDTYLLDTGAMARGEVDGHCCTNELDVDDCFELGRQSYNTGDHYHTILWMNEALVKADEAKRNSSRSSSGVTEADILEYLAFSTYSKGEIARAISLTKQLLELDPGHPRAKGNIGHYEKLLDDRRGEDGRQSDQDKIWCKLIQVKRFIHFESFSFVCFAFTGHTRMY
ncbi:unnamed protein product, partial [Allacma fusca]